jgi:hypothetical protein
MLIIFVHIKKIVHDGRGLEHKGAMQFVHKEQNLTTPLDLNEGPVSMPSVFEAPFRMRDYEKAEASVLWSHVEELFHLEAVPCRVMPGAPVARKLGEFGALQVHVLDGSGYGRGLLPLGQSSRPGLPPHDDGNHVRTRCPSAGDLLLGHQPPLVVLLFSTASPRSPSDVLPVLVVVLQSQLLHLHHALFAKDDEFGGMLTTGKVLSMEGSPKGGVEERLKDVMTEGRGVRQELMGKDGAAISNAREHRQVVVVGLGRVVYFAFLVLQMMLVVPPCGPHSEYYSITDDVHHVSRSHGLEQKKQVAREVFGNCETPISYNDSWREAKGRWKGEKRLFTRRFFGRFPKISKQKAARLFHFGSRAATQQLDSFYILFFLHH